LSGIVTPFFGFAYRKLQKSFGIARRPGCGDFRQSLTAFATLQAPETLSADIVLENNDCRSKYLF
jgi:hypothetical protein